MSRKKIEKQLTLEELIPQYGEQNTQCNALKKVVADLNAKIKKALGVEQLPVRAKDGLTMTIKSFEK